MIPIKSKIKIRNFFSFIFLHAIASSIIKLLEYEEKLKSKSRIDKNKLSHNEKKRIYKFDCNINM